MLFSFQVYSEAGLVITFIRNNTALPAFHHVKTKKKLKKTFDNFFFYTISKRKIRIINK